MVFAITHTHTVGATVLLISFNLELFLPFVCEWPCVTCFPLSSEKQKCLSSVAKRAAAYPECDSASATRGPSQKDQSMLVLTSLLSSVQRSGLDRIDLGLPLRT